MVPETHPPFPIMCLLASFCSPLFWSFVFQAASPNAIPLKCVRSSRFFILLFIFLDTIPYLRLHTKHTHTQSPTLHLHLDTSKSECLPLTPLLRSRPICPATARRRQAQPCLRLCKSSTQNLFLFLNPLLWLLANCCFLRGYLSLPELWCICDPSFIFTCPSCLTPSLCSFLLAWLCLLTLSVITASCPDSQTLTFLLLWSLPHCFARFIFLKWIWSWSLACFELCGGELSYLGWTFTSLGNWDATCPYFCGHPKLLVIFQTLCPCLLCPSLCLSESHSSFQTWLRCDLYTASVTTRQDLRTSQSSLGTTPHQFILLFLYFII